MLLWSMTIPLVRSMTEHISPITAGAVVQLVAGVFCIGAIFRNGGFVNRIRCLPRKYLLGCGALFTLYMLALYLAVGLAANRNQALEVGLINYLWCPLTILFSLILLDTRANLLLVPGTILALAGVYLVTSRGETPSWTSFVTNIGNNPSVYVFALVAALSWALYSNLTRRWAAAAGSEGVLLFIPVSGLVLLVLCFLGSENNSWNSRVIAEVIFLGAATALAYALWDMAMRRGDVVLVAAWSYLTPLLASLLGCVYLGTTMGTTFWIGCALIITGSFVSWLSVSHRTSPATADRPG